MVYNKKLFGVLPDFLQHITRVTKQFSEKNAFKNEEKDKIIVIRGRATTQVLPMQ
jgi:hypothetical protein